MLKEIGEDFYCSNGFICDVKSRPYRCLNYFVEVGMCPNCHRKHPTPEQYKEEYGREYKDDWAVYCKKICIKDKSESDWFISNYSFFKEERNRYLEDGEDLMVICACTPYGKNDKKQGEKKGE